MNMESDNILYVYFSALYIQQVGLSNHVRPETDELTTIEWVIIGFFSLIALFSCVLALKFFYYLLPISNWISQSSVFMDKK